MAPSASPALPRRGRVLRVVGLAVTLAVLIIGVALYIGGAFNSSRLGNTFRAADRGAAVQTPTRVAPVGIAATGGGPESQGGTRLTAGGEPAIAALDKYWADVQQHDFGAAFGYFAAGATDLTESQFISDEERSGIKTVSFRGTVIATAKSSATVGVLSLIIRDQEDGCGRSSGSYTMVEEDNFWRILDAALTTRSC